MLIDGPYRCPFGIIIFPLIIHIDTGIEGKGQSQNIAYINANTCGGNGVFDIRYVMGLAFPFNVHAKVGGNTVHEVVSGDVLSC